MPERDQNDARKLLPHPERIAELLRDREDLVRRLEVLRDEASSTRARLRKVSSQIGKEVRRQRRGALHATRDRAAQAREMAGRLPAPGALLTQARETSLRLRPGARKAQDARRQQLRWLAVAAGLAAVAATAAAVLRRLRGQPAEESEPAGEVPDAEGTDAEPEEAAEPAAGAAPHPGPATDGQVGLGDHLASDHPIRGQ